MYRLSVTGGGRQFHIEQDSGVHWVETDKALVLESLLGTLLWLLLASMTVFRRSSSHCWEMHSVQTCVCNGNFLCTDQLNTKGFSSHCHFYKVTDKVLIRQNNARQPPVRPQLQLKFLGLRCSWNLLLAVLMDLSKFWRYSGDTETAWQHIYIQINPCPVNTVVTNAN